MFEVGDLVYCTLGYQKYLHKNKIYKVIRVKILSQGRQRIFLEGEETLSWESERFHKL